jgi:hypothetical protein
MKSITSISAALILLAVSYPAFAQAPTQDQTQPPQSVSAPGAMPMPGSMGQTGGRMMPTGSMPVQGQEPGSTPLGYKPMMQGQAPGAMQPGAMPMGDMPMMQGQPGMMQPGAMPCMQGQPGMMRPGMMPMGGQPCGMGMMMNPAMMQEHMQRMEAHMANIETLLRQLVELQQKK